MDGAQGLLARIQAWLSAKRYRIRIHAVRHMIEEGFDEDHLLEALAGRSRIERKSTVDSRLLTVKMQPILTVSCRLWTVN